MKELIRLTYNCNPESLGEIAPEAFVDAFENEVVAWHLQCAVTVTFNPGRSEVTSVAFANGDESDPAEYENEFNHLFKQLAEKAFRHCCEEGE